MAIRIPVVQTPIMLAAMFENEKMAQLLATGVINLTELSPFATKGDYVNIPRLTLASDFARIDISSETSLSYTHIATTDDKAVVLRDASGNQYYEHDLVRTGQALDAILSRSVGEKLAKRLLGQIGRIAVAAVAGADTPSANVHQYDAGNAAITIDTFRKARQKMGDEMEVLTTAMIHSSVWGDLLRDCYNSYAVENVMGTVINDGKLRTILGIGNFVVTDQVPTSGIGTGTTSDDDYHTLLFGPGAIQMAFQAQLRQSVFVDSRPGTTIYKVKRNVDYVCHPSTMAWSGSANPSDADLAGSNWTVAYDDHRAFRIVDHISNVLYAS